MKEKIIQIQYVVGGFWGKSAIVALTDKGNIWYMTSDNVWKKDVDLPKELQSK